MCILVKGGVFILVEPYNKVYDFLLLVAGLPWFRIFLFVLIALIASIVLIAAGSEFAVWIVLLIFLLIPQIIWIKVATLFVPFITHPAAMFCLIFLYIAGAVFLVIFLLYWLYIQSLNLCSCISK